MPASKLNLKQIEGLVYYGLDHNLTVTQIYQLYNPSEETENLPSIASHWKRGKKVQAIFDKVELEIEGRRRKMMEELKTSINENTDGWVDFTDKGKFIEYLVAAANRITDDKLKNDILKMLSDHLDFKDESKRDDSNQIQRFYLPLRCQDCKLYLERQKSVTL